jgi:predicted branched-subunit amino acid permease
MPVCASTKPPLLLQCPFIAGFRAAWLSVLAYVLMGTYIGIAALAHDFGFSLWWLALSTVLVWAGPGQVILISALAAGAGPIETAMAVTVSSARLLPMVISLLPLLGPTPMRKRRLILPAHLTAVSMWIESMRLLPGIGREARIPFATGLGLAFMTAAQLGSAIGYLLAASLPSLFAAGLLFLTPISFLISTARNCRIASDWLALAFGLVIGPILAKWQIGLDLLWTGIIGGSLAYGLHRLVKWLK